MSWLDVTERPELDFQCDGNRNRPINLLIFILMLLMLAVPQLVKQLPASHGTGRFTTPPSANGFSPGLSIIFYKINFNIILPSMAVSSK
jgi:hypothetical protein